MAGSLKRVPESTDVGYCCFIVVMPAEGMISAVFHCCTRVAQHHHQCGASNSHMSPDERGLWQAHCTDRKTN